MNAQTSRNRWLWLAPLALAFALLGVLLVLLPAQAQGTVRYVAKGGSDSGACSNSGSPCLTIAYAIAQASAGDTIQIGAGTYGENLTVDRALTFIGAGADATFVDGGGTGRVFTATNFSSLALSSLTVQNGNDSIAGGLYVPDGGLSLNQVNVLSNTAVSSGGAAYVNVSAVITGGRFQNNACTGAGCGGGALYVYGPLLITGTQVISNSAAGAGGGVYADDSVSLAAAQFISNTAGSSGGGVNAAGIDADVTAAGSVFQGNVCTDADCIGGGLNAVDRLIVSGTRFVNNRADYGGALAQSGDGTGEIVNTLFARNTANVNGAAAYLASSEPVTILFTTIASPTVGATAAISIEQGTLNVTNTIFSNYLASIDAAGETAANSDYNLFYNAPTAVVIGGNSITGTNPLFVDPVADNYRLQSTSPAADAGVDLGVNTDLDGVARPQGAGFSMGAYEIAYAEPGCFATLDDTLVYSSTDASAVQQAVDAATAGALVKVAGFCPGVQVRSGFTQTVDIAKPLTLQGGYTATNWATTHPITQPTTLDATGAGRVISATASLVVANLTVQNGVVANYGGGIRTNSALTLTGVTVYSNTAQIGGGLYAEGATTYAAALTMTGAQFLTNTASSGPGGGMMVFGRLTIADSQFDGNHAEWGDGGGIYVTGPITFTDVAFTNNSVAQSGASGGAVYANSGPAINIIAALTNVTVTANTAVETAGGILLNGFGHTMIDSGHFEANRCTSNMCTGGGLLLSDGSATLSATQFISNEAGYQGGGLSTIDVITITQGLFERNVVRQSGGMGGGLAAGGTQVMAVVSDTHFISNTAGTGGGVRFFGPAQLIGGAFAGNTGDAVYAARSLAITPTLPYTYTGNFTLEGDLSVTGELTFTTGTVIFWGTGGVHYLTNAANTTFDRLSVSAQSGIPVLDVGTSSVAVSGVFTNAGVIHRLAPTQTVTVGGTFVYTDGVGQPTAIITQVGGADIGPTSVRVSANLEPTTNFVCNGKTLSPQAVRRYFNINSGGDDSGVIADLTLRYYAPAIPFYTEANNTTAEEVVIYHCDGVSWKVLDGTYTRTTEGNYRAVTISDYTFTSFSPFVLGNPPSTDANLANLTLSSGALTPTFGWATVNYTASVPNSVTSVQATPIVSATNKATVAVNGVAVNSGSASAAIPLVTGSNIITAIVTAQDGVTTKTYTVTVDRAPSSNANLTGLALSSGALTPVFDPATTGYTAVVAHGATTVTVTPAVTDTAAVIQVNGVTVASGAASAPIALIIGSNVITTVVAAEDGVTTKTYTVTVTRAGDASLQALNLSAGDLTPAFISNTLAYTTPAVTKVVAAAQITAAATYTGDVVSIVVAANGGSPATCPGASCPLTVGSNVISVTVTAADATARTYTVTVERLPSSNAELANLVVRYGALAPPFDAATFVYTASVPSFAVRGVITPTAADADASIVVSDTVVPSGSPAPEIPLSFGDTVITLTVTAEDLTATRLYTLTVTREPPASPWYVQPDGNDGNLCTAFGADLACQTIGGAMNKATGGDTIYLAGATYTESLVITKSLTFIGVNTPTVSGGGTQRVISITAGVDVTLDGLIVADGFLAGASIPTSAGAGIYNAGNLTVTNSTITRNAATQGDYGLGGGVFVASTGSARVIDSTVTSNTASFGGGILTKGGPVIVDHAIIATNLVTGYVASSGGGIYVDGSALVTVTNGSQLLDNRTEREGGAGGGFMVATGTLFLVDSTVADNHVLSNNSGNSGGGGAVHSGMLKASGSTFANNDAWTKGGGLWVNSTGQAELVDSTIFSNTIRNAATNAVGGGIYSQGALTITGGTIEGNYTSSGTGGGVYIEIGRLALSGSTVAGNRGNAFGGGLYIAGGAGHVITNSVFVSNTANQGAGLATRADTPLTVYNSTIYSNTALNGSGGGVYATPALTILGGAIYSNTSNSNGAGVYAYGALTMTNVTVKGNFNSVSSYGAGAFANAGATISGSRFENNSCTGACNGAGLYTYDPAALLTLVDTQFISNVATNVGGGLYAVGPVALTGGEFRGNRANSSPTGSGLYAQRVVTITASTPYTYIDGFDLRGDLTVSDNLTFTNGAVNFVVDPYNQTTVVTHTLNGLAATSFNGLAVVDYSVLDVGSSVVRVTGAFTNAGVINRLAPNQSIDTLNTPYTFDDGVGRATVVITQTGGAPMGGTSVWVSAHLPASAVTCGAAPLSTTAVRRYFIITPTVGSGVTADLALAYFDGAANSEANGTLPPNLAIFRCNNGIWGSPATAYTTDSDGAWRWVRMAGHSFNGFGAFAIGALPSRDAALTNLVLEGATVTPALTPAFAANVFNYTTTVASDVFTVTAQPTVSDTTAVARVNGVIVASDARSGPIGLAFGATVITTAVTAQDGVTTQVYTITVTRPPTCMATPDDGVTAFMSFDGSAVQQAVDAAAPSATVKVAGNCRGVAAREATTQTLYISQTLTLAGGYSFTDWNVSNPGAQPTTLDATGGGRVLYATAPVTVANLTVQNGAITGSEPVCPGAGCGGGVYAGADLHLSNVQVVSNTAVHGGGVHGNTAVTIAGGRFENNVASGDGGGLRAAGAAAVADTAFVSNTAANAGGALLEGASTVANTRFVGNATAGAGAAGGGYFNGIAALTNVTFTNNTAGSTGGGGAVFAVAATVTGGEFVSNTAAFAGGGVYFNGAATLTGTRIANNTATANRGGGAYFNDTATLSNTVFTGNAVTNDRGGGAYFRGAADLAATSFISNTASSRAGGAYFFATATLTDTNFIGNVGTVRAGGAWVGGAAVVNGGLFQDNQCTSTCLGGGLFVSDTLTLSGAQFIGNVVDATGGGLLTQSNADVASTVFVGNGAGSGGGAWGQAGGTSARIVNSLFTGNRTGSGQGDAIGVLMADNSGRVTVLHTTIASPTVSTGAAIYVSVGTVEITNTIIASHTASIQNAGGVVASDYNLFFNAPTTVITGSHSIEGRAPRFVDAATGDYHLAAGSPAIDAGADVGVTVDLEGAPRPQGAGYDIGAYESPLSSNADLASLALSQGVLTPPFASATTQYTATVAYSVASITVTPATVAPNATISINGSPVLSGTASNALALAVGENLITTTVTAPNGVKVKHYTVVVTRANLATLDALAITPGALTPAFISTTLAYTALVNNAAATLAVTPTASAGNIVSVTVSQNSGTPIACSGAETTCPLVVGVNVVTVTVTAADGTTQSYSITVTRASTAQLGGLELGQGALTPAFISTTFVYSAQVGNATASTLVTPTASPGDTISVTVAANGGAPVACPGAPAAACPLAVGENAVTVTVTAADGATHTYTITVTRAPSADATLRSLALSTGTLAPVFAPETTNYTAAVANSVASITVTPATAAPNATITVNGVAVLSGTASSPIALSVGATVVTTTVTAQDGVTVKHYVVTITRAPSSNADLSGLALSSGGLTPVFTPAATVYTATVAHTVTSITVTPTASEPNATITVNGAPVASGTASGPLALNVGANVIAVVVTAQDGVTPKSYTVTVTRASQGTLGDLSLAPVTLTPSFISTTLAYTAAVGARTDAVTITAAATQAGDGIVISVAVNGGSPVACPGNPTVCPLQPGVNVITIVVTAADGTQQSYTVTVTRPAAGVDAINDAAGVLQGNAVVIDPLANDSDPAGGGLTIIGVGLPSRGVVVIDAGAKAVTYTPDPTFHGADAFTYTVQDVNGTTDTAQVTVIVTPNSQTNDAPQIGVVDNDSGSQLVFTDTTTLVTVTAPAGSYAGPLGPQDIFYLVYTPVMTPTSDVNQQPGGLKFGNLIFDLAAFLNNTQLENYQFPGAPLTVVITYDPAQLGGIDPATLTPFYWNGAAWVSDGITVVARDLAAHTLTMTISHLSEFALFGGRGHWEFFIPFVVSASVMTVAAPDAPAAPPEATPPVPPVEAPVEPPVTATPISPPVEAPVESAPPLPGDALAPPTPETDVSPPLLVPSDTAGGDENM